MISVLKRVMNAIDLLMSNTLDSELKSFESLIKLYIHQRKYPVQDDEYNYHNSRRRISYRGNWELDSSQNCTIRMNVTINYQENSCHEN